MKDDIKLGTICICNDCGREFEAYEYEGEIETDYCFNCTWDRDNDYTGSNLMGVDL
jgi:hypothetical protein